MIARKSALIMITSVLDGLLGYVALFFITRYMGPEEYGLVAFALSFVTLFTIFGKLGFDNAHIKRVSEGKDLGKCIGTYLTSRAVFAILMTLILIVFIFFWKIILGRGFETSTHELAIYIMVGYMVIRFFAQSFNETFKAKKEIAKARISYLSETLIRLILTIYVALAGFGAIALAFTYVGGEIAFFLSGLYFFRRYPIKKPSFEYFKDYSKFALPLIIVVSSSVIMNNIDKILIQLFRSADDVGYYFAAFRISKFINTFAAAAGALLFPTFSMLYTNSDARGSYRLIFSSERYISMIIVPMVFGLVVLAGPSARILLSGWEETIPILQILPFSVLFIALKQPYQSQILGMDKPKIVRNQVFIMVCCNVFLNIVLIPKNIQIIGLDLAGLGAIGAAIATVISFGLGLLYSRIMVWKLTGVKGNPRIVLHLFAGVIMLFILHIILYELNLIDLVVRWYHLLGVSLLGLGIYLGILALFREFTSKELHFFLDALNIKKMFSYIRDELKNK